MIQKLKDNVGWIGALVGIIATIAGVVWWVAKLDDRVAALEHAKSGNMLSPTALISQKDKTCAELALRYADAASSISGTGASSISMMMERLGCSKMN